MPPAGGSARIVPWSLRRRRPPCGGRDRPPYIAAGNGRQQIHVRFPPVPPAGRCKHRPLRRGVTLHDCHPPAMPAAPWFRRPSALHCRAGVHARRERGGGENMAGLCKCRYAESCDTARRGGARQPGRVLVRQGAAPLSRLAPTLPVCGARIALRVLKHTCVLRPLHLLRLAVSAAGGARLRSPLQGSLSSSRLSIKPPLQGEVDAPQGADGGVHCRLATEISCKPRQGLAPASVGDDACIVPEALRRRRPPCGGRDRPPYIAAGNGRNRYTSAFRQPRRRADASIGPYAEG